jgi:hypothetical protein
MTDDAEHPPGEQAPEPAKAGRKQGGRFAPGVSGNPRGRARGSRSRATVFCQALLDGEAEQIVQATITAAKAGDVSAQKLCLDRLIAPVKDRPVVFALIETPGGLDVGASLASLAQAVAAGRITPGEASDVSRLLETAARAIELEAVQARLDALEAMLAKRA